MTDTRPYEQASGAALPMLRASFALMEEMATLEEVLAGA